MVWSVPIEYVSHCMGHDSVETTQKFYADYRDKMVLGEVRSILKSNKNRSSLESCESIPRRAWTHTLDPNRKNS